MHNRTEIPMPIPLQRCTKKGIKIEQCHILNMFKQHKTTSVSGIPSRDQDKVFYSNIPSLFFIFLIFLMKTSMACSIIHHSPFPALEAHRNSAMIVPEFCFTEGFITTNPLNETHSTSGTYHQSLGSLWNPSLHLTFSQNPLKVRSSS